MQYEINVKRKVVCFVQEWLLSLAMDKKRLQQKWNCSLCLKQVMMSSVQLEDFMEAMVTLDRLVVDPFMEEMEEEDVTVFP
jgi:hypothetical protein